MNAYALEPRGDSVVRFCRTVVEVPVDAARLEFRTLYSRTQLVAANLFLRKQFAPYLEQGRAVHSRVPERGRYYGVEDDQGGGTMMPIDRCILLSEGDS